MRSTLSGLVLACLLLALPTVAAGQDEDPCAGWTTRVVAEGLGSLENLEPDGTGGMLVSASARDAVERVLPDGTVADAVASDMPSPGGLRVRDGILYATTGNSAASGAAGTPDGTIERIDLATGDRETWTSGLTMPNGLVLDDVGNAYTSRDVGSDAHITRIPADDPTTPDTTWADLADTNGMAIDPAGQHLYVATTFNAPASVYQVALDDPTDIAEVAQLATVGNPLPKGLDDLTIDADGILYITANGSGELLRLDPTTGAACQITDQLMNPSAVKFGAGAGWPADHLYVTGFDGRLVEVIPPAAGPAEPPDAPVAVPVAGPVPPDFSCPARSWIAGTSELCGGVLTHRDYVYDDYGADQGTTASSTGTLALPAGDVRYAEGQPANTADLVDLSIRLRDGQLDVLAELNALYEPGTTVLGLAIDTDDDPATGGGPWPTFGGVASDGWDVLYTFEEADVLANLIGGSVPRPTGDRWRLQAVVAQAGGPEAPTQVMNVAFRGPDELARFTFPQLSPPEDGAWFEDLQAAALRDGDISAFGLAVDVADLEGGATRQLDAVGPGLHERVYTSDVTLPPGEGMSYEGIGGRGTGGPSGAFGQVFHYFGRYQPYGLYLPDQPGPHQLGMIYHGSNQNHSQLVNLPGLQAQVAEGPNRILAAPLARGVHGYGSDISERDLEDVEADVRAHHDVEPDSRVLAAGYSQGGYVALRQAALHPDRFSSLISWVGFTGDASNPAPTGGVTAGAVGNVLDLVGNYRHIPAALVYGGADELVHATSSQALATRFREQDFPYVFYFHPTADHFLFALLDEWGKEAAYTADRPPAVDPSRVTFRTAEVLGSTDVGIRQDVAHWVSQVRGRVTVADHLDAPDAYIDVDLQSGGCGADVTSVSLVPGAGPSPVPWTSDEHVVSGGSASSPTPNLDGSLANVASLVVDVAATCLTGPITYDITADGPGTIRFTDGRRLEVAEGANSGTLPAGADSRTTRLAGSDRVRTAVAISQATAEQATTVVLARADDYADALGAGPLAAQLDAPLLLTARDRLDPAVAAEIARLQPAEVVIVGGPAAVDPAVATQVAELGPQVRRLAGPDRFATAAAVASAVVEAGGDATHAYLVEGSHPDPGRGWPDAVAVGGLAARQGRPVLLGQTDGLPDATLGALAELGTTTVTAVGGTAAISDRTLAMAADPDGDGIGQVGLHRLAGADRYATSAAVADRTLDDLATTEAVWIVTGRDWPDALSAGPAAARTGAVLLLVDGAQPDGGPVAAGWRSANAPVEDLVVIGGPAAVVQPGR